MDLTDVYCSRFSLAPFEVVADMKRCWVGGSALNDAYEFNVVLDYRMVRVGYICQSSSHLNDS